MSTAAPPLPPPVGALDLFIARHGRKFAAFFFGLLAVVIVGLTFVSVLSLVAEAHGKLVVELGTATLTAIGSMCSLFLVSNAAGDFAHRTPKDQPPAPRASGTFPAAGVPS